jgi:hypothetical protein
MAADCQRHGVAPVDFAAFPSVPAYEKGLVPSWT